MAHFMTQPPGAGLLPCGQYSNTGSWKGQGGWDGMGGKPAPGPPFEMPGPSQSPAQFSLAPAAPPLPDASAALNLIHSLAGDWTVSDPYPPDASFTGMKVHADGAFFCTAGPIRSGEIQTSNPQLREVRVIDIMGNTFLFSVTQNGRHMAGRNVMTNQVWHLEKGFGKNPRLGVKVESQASSLSSANPQHHASRWEKRKSRRTPIGSSLGSEPSSCSEITPRRLKEIIERAWQAGRASAEESNSAVSSNSWNAPDTEVQQVSYSKSPTPAAPPAVSAKCSQPAERLAAEKKPRIARAVPPTAQGGGHSRKSSKEFDGRKERLLAMLSSVAGPSPDTTPVINAIKVRSGGLQRKGCEAGYRLEGDVCGGDSGGGSGAGGGGGGVPQLEPAVEAAQNGPFAYDGNVSNVACPVVPSLGEGGVAGMAPAGGKAGDGSRDNGEGAAPGVGREHCRVFGEVRTRKQGSDEQQRALNKDIIACSSAKDVFSCLERSKKDGVDPNAVCLSTAAYKVARLNGVQDEWRHHVLEFIVNDVLTHGLKGWDAQALAKLLWACATAGFRSTELFGAAEDFVHHEGLRTFRAQHLAYLVWSFSTMGQRSSALYEKVDTEIVKRGLATFNSQDICMCLKGLTGQRHAACYRVAEADISRRGLASFNNQEITGMLGAFAATGQRYKKILDLVNESPPNFALYSFQALASIARSVGTIISHEPHVTPSLCGHFFQMLEAEVEQRVNVAEAKSTADVLPQYICSIAWAFAKAGLYGSPVFGVLKHVVVSKQTSLQALSLEQIAKLSWAYSIAESRDVASGVLTMVCAELRRRGNSVQLTGSDTHQLLQAIAAVSSHLEDPCAACTVVAKGLTAKRLRHFKDSELIGCLKVFAGHSVKSDALTRKVVAEVAKRGLKGMDSNQLATLGWVFARWGCGAGVSIVAGEADRRPLRQLSPFELSILAWVFCMEKQVASADRIINEALKRPSWAFSPRELADLVLCAITCDLDCTQLLRKVEADVLNKGFASYQDQASVVALLFYGYLAPSVHDEWQATKAWIALPPRSQPSQPLITALVSVGCKPVQRQTIGDFTYAITLPELRIVVEDVSEPRPTYFSTTSIGELKRLALRHEGWGLINLDFANMKKQKRGATLKEMIDKVSHETEVFRLADDDDDDDDDDELAPVEGEEEEDGVPEIPEAPASGNDGNEGNEGSSEELHVQDEGK